MLLRSVKETQKLAREFARNLPRVKSRGATVVALTGELGSAKTTFTQAAAKALGVREQITSPTFIIQKIYKLPRKSASSPRFQRFIHIDAYRIKTQDLKQLGFDELVRDKNNIIFVEWPERVKKLIPKTAIWIKFSHVDKNTRRVVI